MKYSIIVPAYNSALSIEKCLSSIIEQTYTNVEIIVIDDGSTDNTKEILKKINNDKIIYIHQKNSGVSAARNHGLKIATGDYISFIDADDYIENNTIEEIDKIINQTDASIVKYNYNKIVGKTKAKYHFSSPTNELIESRDFPSKIYPNIYSSYDFSNVWNVFYKRDTLIGIKFDVNYKYGEDFKYMIDALENANNIYIYDKELYNYVYNSSSATNLKKLESTQRKLTDNLRCMSYVNKKIGVLNNQIGYIERIKNIYHDYLNNFKINNYEQYKYKIEATLSLFNTNEMEGIKIHVNMLTSKKEYKKYIKYSIKVKIKTIIRNILQKGE